MPCKSDVNVSKATDKAIRRCAFDGFMGTDYTLNFAKNWDTCKPPPLQNFILNPASASSLG
jgi:hypothetical protein